MTEPILQDLFAESARRHADRLAVLSGGERWLYRELEAEANRIANSLLEGGALPGAIVALWLGSSHHVITSILGVLRAGCVFMPLDGHFPDARLTAMLEVARPSWVIVDHLALAGLPRLRQLSPRPLKVLGLDVEAHELPPAAYTTLTADEQRPPGGTDPEAMCSIYFTSGSTGRPKAIAGRLKGIGHFAQWEIEAFGVRAGSRASQLVSPAFDGYLRDVFVPLLAGGTVCIPASRDTILDPAALCAYLEESGVELLHCVPSLLRALLNAPLTRTSLPSLSTVALFGEAVLPADVTRFFDLFGRRVRLFNLYGPTETTMVKLCYPVQPEDRQRRVLPVGKPIPGCDVLLLDERQRPCPLGVVGEIYLSTPYRSLGYLHQPELTRQVFLPHPLRADSHELVYRTGDFGRLMADGNLEFLGRRDGQVKIRGVRIEMSEIESALREHPSVRDVAVVDREDGAAGRTLCAYLVIDGELDAAAMRAHLAARLPEVMVPARLVALAALPRTFNGKLDRKALPDPRHLDAAAGTADPEGPTEELLAQLWVELLGIERISRQASFFELGGHSLLAMQLLTRIRVSFGVELPVRELFDLPRLASLATRLDELRRQGGGVGLPPLTAVAESAPVLASFGQAEFFRRWVGQGWRSSLAAPVSFAITGPLGVALLRRSFTALLAAHDVLRTRLVEVATNGACELIQETAPIGALKLPVIDLSALGEVDAGRSEPRLLAARVEGGPQSWATPALDLWLLRLAPEEHRLQLLLLAAMIDEVSLQHLHGELVGHYRAGGEGKAPRADPQQPRFRDWIAWRREREREGAFETQLEAWRRRLEGAGPALALKAEPGPAEGPAASQRRELDTELVDGLRRQARAERSTPFLLLLAGFVTALRRRTGREEILLGVPFAGRTRAGTEAMIGPLSRLLPLRFQLDEATSDQALLAQVKERALEAHAHQEVPLARLFASAWPAGGVGEERFPVRFVYQRAGATTAAEVEALSIRPGTVGASRQGAELVLRVIDYREGVRVLFEYRSDRLSSVEVNELAERALACWARLGAPEPGLVDATALAGSAA